MDIIGLLPVEQSFQVLELLDVRSLGNCLMVSKKWRELANNDFLWRKHCTSYGVSPPIPDGILVFYLTESPDLCYWALVWKSFGCTPAYKWHTNRYESLKLHARNDYTCFACHGNNFAAYSSKFNNINVYSVIKCLNMKCNSSRIKLITSVALCFPKISGSGNVTLCLEENYLVAGKGDIVIIFEKENDKYNLFKAIKIGFTYQFASRNIYDFVQQHFSQEFSTEIFGIIDCFLWLYAASDDQAYVVNLITNEVRNVFCYNSCSIESNYFLTWSDVENEDVRLYDREGNLHVFLDNLPGIEDVVVNDRLICILRGDLAEESLVDVWQLSTGNNLFSRKMPLCTWCRLHPTEDILYTLEASLSESIYRITSWNVQTQKVQWVFQNRQHDRGSLVTHWELSEVCGKYLVVWPLSSGQNNFGVINAETGEFIYSGTRPHVDPELSYITDTFWLSVSRQYLDITVRSYL